MFDSLLLYCWVRLEDIPSILSETESLYPDVHKLNRDLSSFFFGRFEHKAASNSPTDLF